MRPLPRRVPSKAAIWSLRIAGFAPVLGVMSVIAHQSGSVDTPSFFVLLAVVLAIALFTLFLVILAFRSLWVHGKRGGRRASWALFVTALVLFPYAVAAVAWIGNPQVSEVSTDRIDPPVYRSELLEFGARAPTLAAATLTDAYPQLSSRRYNVALEVILDTVLEIAEENRWQLVGTRGRIGVDDDQIAEFTDRSFLLGLPRRIVVRVRDEGDTSLLDIRSSSVYGTHDLGSNARIIRQFIADVDFNSIGRTE